MTPLRFYDDEDLQRLVLEILLVARFRGWQQALALRQIVLPGGMVMPIPPTLASDLFFREFSRHPRWDDSDEVALPEGFFDWPITQDTDRWLQENAREISTQVGDFAYRVLNTEVRDVPLWRWWFFASTVATGLFNGQVSIQSPSGVKTWRSVRDDRVRDAHVEAQGQTVAVDEPFIVGGFPMMFPGDMRAPADLWMNCRCVMTTSTLQNQDRPHADWPQGWLDEYPRG